MKTKETSSETAKAGIPGIPPEQLITIKFNFDELSITYGNLERDPKRIDSDGYLELSNGDLINKIFVDPKIVNINPSQKITWKLELIKGKDDPTNYFLDKIEFLNNADALEIFEVLPWQDGKDSKKKTAHAKPVFPNNIVLMYSVKFIVTRGDEVFKIKFDPIIQSHTTLQEFFKKPLIKDLGFKEEIRSFIFASSKPIFEIGDVKVADASKN